MSDDTRICLKHNDRFWYLPDGLQQMRCMWCDLLAWKAAYYQALGEHRSSEEQHLAYCEQTDAIYAQNAVLRKLLFSIDAGIVAARAALDKTGLV